MKYLCVLGPNQRPKAIEASTRARAVLRFARDYLREQIQQGKSIPRHGYFRAYLLNDKPQELYVKFYKDGWDTHLIVVYDAPTIKELLHDPEWVELIP